MKLIDEAVRVPALLLIDGTVAALGTLSKAAMTRAKLSAKNQGHEAKEVEVEIKRLDVQAKPHPSTLMHEWIVSSKDRYGEYTLDYSTRKKARDAKKAIENNSKILKLEYVNITHRVFQLVKEEKVS